MPRLRFPSDYAAKPSRGRGPWPGPMPYEEGDEHYRGRVRDAEKLLERIDYCLPLMLITGPSGVGKTSLLRAAVIPQLRGRRVQALGEGEKKTHTPTVLVVRDWVTARHREQRDYDGILKDAIYNSILDLRSKAEGFYPGDHRKALRDRIEQDCNDMLKPELNAVYRGGTAYDYAARLTDEVGSLLLIMDQFEEALRGSTEQRISILDTIADLSKQDNFRIQVVLSFRQEFWFLFRRLDSRIGNLSKVTLYLEPMPEPDVWDAVTLSAESGGAKIDPPALTKLLEWLRSLGRRNSPAESLSPAPEERASGKADRQSSIDLLRLQALLQELYRLESEKAEPGETQKALCDRAVTINEDTVRRLLGQLRSEDPHLTESQLAESALQFFIDRRVFPMPVVEPSSRSEKESKISAATGVPRDLEEEQEEELLQRLLQRRIAARMAPFFSSLGLKVQQYESQLVATALREDWDTLTLDANHVKGFLDSTGLEVGRTNLDLRQLGLVDGEISKGTGILSGRGRAATTRTKSDAVRNLLDACYETFERLEKSSIVRSRTTPEGRCYELVHDGFGTALFDWAEKVRSDPIDTLGAMVAQRGQSFHWKQLGGGIRQVCWRGSLVEPAADCGALVFDNVTWVDCDLRGTIFERCLFKGGSFEECDLHGAVFKNCSFAGSSNGGKPFTLRGIRANGLTFMGGSLTDVAFIDCKLEKMLWDCDPGERDEAKSKLRVSNLALQYCKSLYQWSVVPGTLVREGPLSIDNCDLDLCDLRGLLTDGATDRPGVGIRHCRFRYCLVGELARVIDGSMENRRYPEVSEDVPG